MPERPVLGIDCFAAATHAPGIGRFGRELVRAWLRADEIPVDLRLLEAGTGGRVLASWRDAVEGAGVRRAPLGHRRVPAPRRATDLFARALGVERLVGGCDAFLRARPFAPVCGHAPTLWPVSQWPSSERPGEDDAVARERFVAELAANDHLLVFAEAARARLIEAFDIDASRVHAIGVGAEHWRRDEEPRDAPAAPRTVLVLGAVERRRWPEAVLEAFEDLVGRGAAERLLFVGRRGAGADAFARRLGFSSARARVEWIDAPVEADLPDIVARAALLVHVGVGEATPVTPLEALAFGVPAVVSDAPEMREALGDAVGYLDEPRERRRGGVLAELCAAELERDDTDARARRRATAERFTWDEVARAVAGVVARVAR